jgi:hypothetical protein
MAERNQAKRQRESPLDDEGVEELAGEMVGVFFSRRPSQEARDTIFKQYFGCNSRVVAMAWNMMNELVPMPEGCTLTHFLWSLIFLKSYAVEAIRSSLSATKGRRPDEKTLREWTWKMIEALSRLEEHVVSNV